VFPKKLQRLILILIAACSVYIIPLIIFTVSYRWSDCGLIALLPISVSIFLGTFRDRLRRQRVWRDAVLREGSALWVLLGGKFTAALAATATMLLTVPVIAHFALTSNNHHWTLFIVIGVAAIFATVFLREAIAPIVRRPFMTSVAKLPVAFILGAFAFVGHAAIVLSSPLPKYVDAPNLATALGEAIAALPSRTHIIAEAFALVEAVDASALWLAAADSWTLPETSGSARFGVIPSH
jgi:hypothetical protein